MESYVFAGNNPVLYTDYLGALENKYVVLENVVVIGLPTKKTGTGDDWFKILDQNLGLNFGVGNGDDWSFLGENGGGGGGNKEKYQELIQTTATTLGALQTSSDLTIVGIKNLQQLANKIAGTSYKIINLGDSKIIQGFTVDALGRKVAVIGVILTASDIINDGLNWNNGTDAAMSGVALIPGIGWAFSAAYFIANPIVKSYTGESIGEHIHTLSDQTRSTFGSMWNTLKGGLSRLESSLRTGYHF